MLIERGPTSYGAYVPDLPGCVVVAEIPEGVDRPQPPAASRFLVTLDITVSTYQPEIMRTTVTLDQDVYEVALHLSRSSGERFPTFEVAPDAPVIPATRIQRILDEEGLF